MLEILVLVIHVSHVYRRRQIGDNPGLLVQGAIVTPRIVWVEVVIPICYFKRLFFSSADYIIINVLGPEFGRCPRINPGMHVYSIKDFSVNGQRCTLYMLLAIRSGT